MLRVELFTELPRKSLKKLLFHLSGSVCVSVCLSIYLCCHLTCINYYGAKKVQKSLSFTTLYYLSISVWLTELEVVLDTPGSELQIRFQILMPV